MTTGEARRAVSRLRRLLGDDIAPLPPSSSPDRPATLLEPRAAAQPVWELGGLDLELGRLLLDEGGFGDRGLSGVGVLERWEEVPRARLVVHPLLDQMQVWGPHLPRQAAAALKGRLKALGLVACMPLPAAGADWSGLRATGARLTPAVADRASRRQCLRDALAIGGGCVELVEEGQVLAALAQRPADLTTGLVGPRQAIPAHSSRRSPLGACPMCGGSGQVTTLPEPLIINDPTRSPTDPVLLSPQAAQISKGMRRSELTPFFRRLSREGLWDPDCAFADLSPHHRRLFLFGFWHRPGPGSFLKKPSADPSEVGSWLRWNGLYRHLEGLLTRSSDARWQAAVEEGAAVERCPCCRGTGLGRLSRLLMLSGRSLLDVVESGTAEELVDALRGMTLQRPRQHRTRDRILTCLAPLLTHAPHQRLIKPTPPHLARQVLEAASHAFTGLPLAREDRDTE